MFIRCETKAGKARRGPPFSSVRLFLCIWMHTSIATRSRTQAAAQTYSIPLLHFANVLYHSRSTKHCFPARLVRNPQITQRFPANNKNTCKNIGENAQGMIVNSQRHPSPASSQTVHNEADAVALCRRVQDGGFHGGFLCRMGRVVQNSRLGRIR